MRRSLASALLAAAFVTMNPATPSAHATGLRCFGRDATIVGTHGQDTLVGTSGLDVIVGLGGDDTIRSRGGHDYVCGGPGDDTIRTGRAGDLIRAQAGDDTILGSAGAAGGRGDDLMRAGPDGGGFSGGPGDDRFVGSADSDWFTDARGTSVVRTKGGDDRIKLGGRGRVYAGSGQDEIHLYRACACEAHAGAGRVDIVDVRGSASHVYGDRGRDYVSVQSVGPRTRLVGGPGRNTLYLGLRRTRAQTAAYPRLHLDLSAGTLRAGGFTVPVSGFNQVNVREKAATKEDRVVARYEVFGGSRNNKLTADLTGAAAPRAFLHGRKGTDLLRGGDADDLLDGGPGRDLGNGRDGTDTCVAIETGADGVDQPCEVNR
jgi:Ca2+-binding RTX toxin-like protein